MERLFSMTLVILCSTSLAEAPGHGVITVMTGGSILGRRSSFRLRKDMEPMTRTARKTIRVITGRLTEISGSFTGGTPLSWCRP